MNKDEIPFCPQCYYNGYDKNEAKKFVFNVPPTAGSKWKDGGWQCTGCMLFLPKQEWEQLMILVTEENDCGIEEPHNVKIEYKICKWDDLPNDMQAKVCIKNYFYWNIVKYKNNKPIEVIGSYDIEDIGLKKGQILCEDLSWVAPALKEAYELGKSKGCHDEHNDRYSDHRIDVEQELEDPYNQRYSDEYANASDARYKQRKNLLEEAEKLKKENKKLKQLLKEVTLDEMEGTPDLFYPDRGWEEWNDLAMKLLNESL
jgi:hypothetical protein